METVDLSARLAEAKRLLRMRKVPEAAAAYEELLRRAPDSAEANHFMGLVVMQRGELARAVHLIRRSIELEPCRPEFHNNLSIVLGRMNQFPAAMAAADRAISLNPVSPEAWFNKGHALRRMGRLPEAYEALRGACLQGPDNTAALGELGEALLQMGRRDEAIGPLRRVTELAPGSPAGFKTLAHALRQADRPIEAARVYRRVLELTPRSADAHNDLGAVLQELGQVDESEALLRRCLELNPEHPDGHWNLGLSLLIKGRWQDGWLEYEWRRKLRQDAGQKRQFPFPAWDGSPPEGKSLLMVCEQGLGDTIQFVRYATVIARHGARVSVECQPVLRPLIRSVESVERVLVRGEPLPRFDLHVRLLTLPNLLGSTPDNVPNQVPYLHVDDARVAGLAKALAAAGPGMKVGLVWQGSIHHRGDRFRSIPLANMLPLARVPGVRWINLQKGKGVEQLESHGRPFNMYQWSDPTDLSDRAMLDTAAVIKNLDLIIAVDTSICHLAGALGAKVWVALPLASDWRWLQGREDTPWYPTMRLFRQRSFGQWGDVIERMATELENLVRSRG
jgi:Flp pilus assembly protein TadD